eukprot:jgi/Chrzof1/14773/Cz09g15190.t1
MSFTKHSDEDPSEVLAHGYWHAHPRDPIDQELRGDVMETGHLAPHPRPEEDLEVRGDVMEHGITHPHIRDPLDAEVRGDVMEMGVQEAHTRYYQDLQVRGDVMETGYDDGRPHTLVRLWNLITGKHRSKNDVGVHQAHVGIDQADQAGPSVQAAGVHHHGAPDVMEDGVIEPRLRDPSDLHLRGDVMERGVDDGKTIRLFPAFGKGRHGPRARPGSDQAEHASYSVPQQQ